MHFISFLKLFLILSLGISIASCTKSNEVTEDKKVAQVYDNLLLLQDVNDLIPDNLNNEDSIEYANTIINNWILGQLKLYNAETNLSIEQKDVAKELDDYRSSLLIYKYEQEYIRQKLDTNISENLVADYYNSFNKEFVLKKNIVIASVAVIPEEIKTYPEFKRWFVSGNSNSIGKISAFCEQYAISYNNYNDDWVFLDNILRKYPFDIDKQELDLKYKRYFETKQDGNYYLIFIHSYKFKGNIAPLNLVERDIENILLNKRKFELVKELEENTFNDANSFKNVKIFKN